MKKQIILFFIITAIVLMGASCSRAPKDISVFKSTDAGDMWEQKAQMDEKKSISHLSVLSIVIDPNNPNNVFIGTVGKGLFRSQNAAETWEKTSMEQGNINTIAIDPQDSNIIYAGGKVADLGKIYQSTDGGNEFSEIYSETHPKKEVNTIIVDHFNPQIVYAGLTSGAFLKSQDQGKSWIATNWFKGPIQTMAMNPIDSRIIFVAVRGSYVYKTKDGGATWLDLKPKLQDLFGTEITYSIAFDPKKKKTVYLGSDYGLLKSTNGGKDWQDVGLLVEQGKFYNLVIAINPKKPKNIYLGIDTNIYKSINGGRDWEVKKITSNEITSLAIDPKGTQNIYAGIREIKE